MSIKSSSNRFTGPSQVSRFIHLAFIAAGSIAAFASTSSTAQAGIDEIVVTASKREQPLQDVPVSVSVVGAQDIIDAGVNDLSDIGMMIPSLRTWTLQQSSAANFEIRGFSSGVLNSGIEPSVAVYVDGVYRSRSLSSLEDFSAIERIEVLKGPQTTLFGKNAAAGVISVTSKGPESEFRSEGSLTLGNYSLRNAKFTTTGPLTDGLLFRLSGSIRERDGYFDNLTDGSTVNDRDRNALKLEFQTADAAETKIRLTLDASDLDEACCGAPGLNAGITAAVSNLLASASGNGFVSDYDPFNRDVHLNFSPTSQFKSSGAALNVEHSFGDIDFTSISSFRKLDTYENFDADFTATDLLSEYAKDQNFETLTQEFRLSGAGDDFAWLVGAMYFKEDLEYKETAIFGADINPFVDTLFTANGLPLANFAAILGDANLASIWFQPGDGITDERYDMETESTSLFGQLDYDLSDTLTASVGIGYIEDEKTVLSNVTIVDPFAALPDATFQGALAPLAGFRFFKPFTNYPNASETGVFKSDDVTYTARLSQSLDENANVYISYATGFKASSPNLSEEGRNADIGRFARPESVSLIEVGYKRVLESGYVNAALFSQEIEDFQTTTFSGTGFVLSNAERQKSEGFEVESMFAPTDNLRLTLGATLIDAKYDSFTKGTCDATPGASADTACPTGQTYRDLSGTRVAGVPKTRIAGSLSYFFDLPLALEGMFRVDHNHASEIRIASNVPEAIASRKISTTNLMLRVHDEAREIDYDFFMKNATEDEYLLSSFPAAADTTAFRGYPNEPRLYGVTIRKSF